MNSQNTTRLWGRHYSPSDFLQLGYYFLKFIKRFIRFQPLLTRKALMEVTQLHYMHVRTTSCAHHTCRHDATLTDFQHALNLTLRGLLIITH